MEWQPSWVTEADVDVTDIHGNQGEEICKLKLVKEKLVKENLAFIHMSI